MSVGLHGRGFQDAQPTTHGTPEPTVPSSCPSISERPALRAYSRHCGAPVAYLKLPRQFPSQLGVPLDLCCVTEKFRGVQVVWGTGTRQEDS